MIERPTQKIDQSLRQLVPVEGEQPSARKFAVYDLEWWPGSYEFRIAGLYGKALKGKKKFIHFTSVEEFLDHILSPHYSGYLFFAHWGGIADVLFFFGEILKRDLVARIAIQGSSAAIIDIRQGKKRWTLCDSSLFFKVAAAEVGEWLGIKKGGDESLSYLEEDVNKLVEYCKIDCEIIHTALDKFQDIVVEMGGRLGLTMASTSMDLFRRRFLKKEISTPYKLNEWAKGAYFASRVEVYQHTLEQGKAFDINSSFVYSMTHPLPGSPLRELDELPEDGSLYIANVRIRVPDYPLDAISSGRFVEHNGYIPPVPYRMVDGRIFFPTGEWQARLTSIDIDLAREHGVEILKVGKIIQYETISDFREFALTVYGERMKADNPFRKAMFKLMGNSGYGKLTEKELKDAYLLNPDFTFCQDHWEELDDGYCCLSHGIFDCLQCRKTCDCFRCVSPGIFRAKMFRALSHRHVATGAFITSIARRTLFRAQQKILSGLAYSDTDSLYTAGDYPDYDASREKELGAFKFEGSFKNMNFIAPKVYGGQYSGGERDGEPILHAKGFGIGKRVKIVRRSNGKDEKIYDDTHVDRFRRILDGEIIESEHMVRPKQFMVSGGACLTNESFVPFDVPVKKALKMSGLQKRSKLGDSRTRPWRLEEILE